MDREEIIGKVQRRDGNGLHYAVIWKELLGWRATGRP